MNSQLLFADSLTSTLLDWLGYVTGFPVLARLHSHIQLMLKSFDEPVLSACGNDVGGDVPDELDKEDVVEKPWYHDSKLVLPVIDGLNLLVEEIHDKFSQIFFRSNFGEDISDL